MHIISFGTRIISANALQFIWNTYDKCKCTDLLLDPPGTFSLTPFPKWYDFFNKVITNPSLFAQIRPGPILTPSGLLPEEPAWSLFRVDWMIRSP